MRSLKNKNLPGFHQGRQPVSLDLKALPHILLVLGIFLGGMGRCWAVATSTPTKTPTYTPSPTVVLTFTFTPTFSFTATPVPTDSRTPTYTATNTPTSTPTFTSTPNKTQTALAQESFTDTPTFTYTPSPTFTFTYTHTNTQTETPTATATFTFTCVPPNGSNTSNFIGGEACYTNEQSLLSATNVFGMSLSDVKNIADYVGSASAGTTLYIPSDWKLSYYDGSVTYGPSQPYPYTQLGAESQKQGAYGVLVVNGNLTLDDESGTTPGSIWNGVLFVTGNLYVGAGCLVSGAVIMGTPYYNGAAAATMTLNGSAGNFGEVLYNAAYISDAQTRVGVYREDVSETKNLLGISYF